MKHLRILVLAAPLAVACHMSDSKTAAAEKGAADVIACAAEAYLANPQLTPEELVAKCGPIAVADAAKILVSTKKVAGARVGASPCPSTSVVPVPSASAAPKASK